MRRPLMSADPLDAVAERVLGEYPAVLARGTRTALGNRGGFSGARLWRLDGPGGVFCLRAWPEDVGADHVDFVHRLLLAARAAGLDFVPAPLPTATGFRRVDAGGRLWELSDWLPGRADFAEGPSHARLSEVAVALARLHRCWERAFGTSVGPCPSVGRRLDVWRQWGELVRSGWRPRPAADDPARDAAERAWQLLPLWLPRVPDWLTGVAHSSWTLQPCVRDPWHDHFLFDGDRFTGLVDYGAAAVDHVAVDLARMTGSLTWEDGDHLTAVRGTALEAYRRVRPLTREEEQLVAVLDRSGAVLALTTWLRRLDAERRPPEDRRAAAHRLNVLVRRVERWTPGRGLPG